MIDTHSAALGFDAAAVLTYLFYDNMACVYIWLYGYMAIYFIMAICSTWLYGYMAIWLYGYMAILYFLFS
jgi:hypothetical protein